MKCCSLIDTRNVVTECVSDARVKVNTVVASHHRKKKSKKHFHTLTHTHTHRVHSIFCHHFRNWEKERENERGVTWDHIKTHQSINHVTKITHLFTTQNPNFSPISFLRRRCFLTLPPPLLYSIQLLLSLSLSLSNRISRFEFTVSWFWLILSCFRWWQYYWN